MTGSAAEEHALHYLRFFVNFLRGQHGPFTLLDAKELIGLAEPDMTTTERLELIATREDFLSDTLADAWLKLKETDSGFVARLPIAYGTDFPVPRYS